MTWEKQHLIVAVFKSAFWDKVLCGFLMLCVIEMTCFTFWRKAWISLRVINIRCYAMYCYTYK